MVEVLELVIDLLEISSQSVVPFEFVKTIDLICDFLQGSVFDLQHTQVVSINDCNFFNVLLTELLLKHTSHESYRN